MIDGVDSDDDEDDDEQCQEELCEDDEDDEDVLAAATASLDDDEVAIVNDSNIVLLLNMNLKVVLCDCGRAYKIQDDDEVLSQLSQETGTVVIMDKDDEEVEDDENTCESTVSDEGRF